MTETANPLFITGSKSRFRIKIPLTSKLRSIVEISLVEANGTLQINFSLYCLNNHNKRVGIQRIGDPLLVFFVQKYRYYVINQQIDDIIKFFNRLSQVRLIWSLLTRKRRYALTNLDSFNMPLSEYDVIISRDEFESKCLAKTFIKTYRVYNVFSESLSSRCLYDFHNLNIELLSRISRSRAEVTSKMIMKSVNYLSHVLFIVLVVMDIFFIYSLLLNALANNATLWTFINDPEFFSYCIYTLVLPIIRPLIPRIIFYVIQKRIEAFFLS